MKVLFITSTRIGDAVLSTGLLSYLNKKYPHAEFTVACGVPAAPLFQFTPYVTDIIPIRKFPLSLHWIKLWAKCSMQYWSLIVDLRSSLISWLLLTNNRMTLRRETRPIHRLESLAMLAGAEETLKPRLFSNAIEKQKAKAYLTGSQQFLAIGPTTNWVGKQWPAENFLELVQRLCGNNGILPDAKIVVLGAHNEIEAALPLIQAIPDKQLVNLVGKLDLVTTVEVIALCDMYIGNDSGLMHIAAASGVPTLGLFGPSKDEHYAPWGDYTATVRTKLSYKDLVEKPGYDHRNTETLMRSLTVDMVEIAASNLWKKVKN